jgi:hypothetical protein
MKTITYEWLSEQGACGPSLLKFNQLFGRKCRLPQTNVRKWLNDLEQWQSKADLHWLVYHLVSRKCGGDFQSLPLARKVLDYLVIRKPGWDTYAACLAYEVRELPKQRLIKAIVQIAEQSPNI